LELPKRAPVKTAAFVLPILNRIFGIAKKTGVTQALIVCTNPRTCFTDRSGLLKATRIFTGVSSIAIYGGGDGDDFSREKQAMKRGVEIIIATPGRLLSHMNIGNTDFYTIAFFLVLDEADRMLDMGFQPDLLRIMRALNVDRQTLMFSATMPNGIEGLARTFLKDPVTYQYRCFQNLPKG
jgi:ATP-dependent RNA helicase RhlE